MECEACDWALEFAIMIEDVIPVAEEASEKPSGRVPKTVVDIDSIMPGAGC